MNELQKNALVVSLKRDVTEIVQLADSLGYAVIKTVIQQRGQPDVNYFIGAGKVEEIKEYLGTDEQNVNLVIIDGELRPSQWFALEKKLDITVYDRVHLILAIFETRAERKEARLQVKLAQLQYERPYVRELIHRARAGEHPGFMAGGEYQVDDYYEMIKKQMKKIRQELQKIRGDRELQRQTRYKSGFFLVSLAGYTNAGKSSLLNLLAGEKVKVEGRLFSTLSTTTRKIKNMKDHRIPILLTDTVGFIDDLPSWIIDAFHSTLEELEVADVVLLVVDVSEEKEAIVKKLQVSINELRDLGVTATIIIVLNKIDLLSKVALQDRLMHLQNNEQIKDKHVIPLSVKDRNNITQLFDIVFESLPNLIQLSIRLPITEEAQSFLSYLYDKTSVTNVVYNSDITFNIECNVKIKDKIIAKCEDLNGSIQ